MPSDFNAFGYSFFILASVSENRELACHLISRMEPKDILCPFAIGPHIGTQTILQWTTRRPEEFHKCWERLESVPDLDLSNALKPGNLYYICEYASVELADKMLARGINIGHGFAKFPNDASSLYAAATEHPESEPLLNWLLQHVYGPQGLSVTDTSAPLIQTIRSGRTQAAIWLISHTKDLHEIFISVLRPPIDDEASHVIM